jgi:hypothetical protein
LEIFKIMQFMKCFSRIPLHVLLVSLYPVLFLYFNNIHELPSGVFIRPCILSSIFSILLFTFIFCSCKKINKSGIITSFVLILFFTYGHIWSLFVEWKWKGVFFGYKFGVTTYLAPLYLVGLLLGLYCFRKMRGDFTSSTIYLNITSLVLVGMSIFNILIYEKKILDDNSQQINITLKANDSKPDIYYINLDGYPRADILKKYYNYDNSPFLERLKSLGFNVIENSQSNYDDTRISIRSTLEMDYLDKFFSTRKEFFRDNKRKGLRYTNVLRILYNSGYKTNAFETASHLTDLKNSPYLNSYFQNISGYNQFDDMLLKTTPLGIILQFIPIAKYRHRERMLFILDSLLKFPKHEGPSFFYVNLVSPHFPIVFDVNGDWVHWPRSNKAMYALPLPSSVKDKDKEFMTVKKYFCDQLTYLNNRILQNIESVLKNADKEFVIIIQSDHGERNLGGIMIPTDHGEKHLDGYFEYDRSVSFCNLSAIYLPNGRQHEIPPDTSNVNTFRYVFNHVFNTRLPILPNRQYEKFNYQGR